MAEFLVELYLSRTDDGALERHAARARAAAEELASGGVPVRYRRAIFLREDETCFLLYEADSAEAVGAAARRAALEFDRVIEAVGAPSAETGSPCP